MKNYVQLFEEFTGNPSQHFVIQHRDHPDWFLGYRGSSAELVFSPHTAPIDFISAESAQEFLDRNASKIPVDKAVIIEANVPKSEYQQRKANWIEKQGDDPDYFKQSLMENEFDTSYMWIKYFGGAELLSSKHIMDHRDFMRALLDGRITIEEIDNATAGAHGQVGDIPWSKTMMAQKIILPYLDEVKNVK